MKSTAVYSILLFVMSILITLGKIPGIGVLQYLNFNLYPIQTICIIVFVPWIFAAITVALYLLILTIVAALIRKL